MLVKIENFRKIENESIDLSLGKINLICGNGHQGKTSVLKSITAISTQEPLPFYSFAGKRLIDKKQALNLVNDSAREAKLSCEENNIFYPECNVVTHGENSIKGTDFSCGLKFYTDLTDKEKSSLLSQLFKTLPSDDLLMGELNKIDLPQAAINKIIESIAAVGWDDTLANGISKKQMLKGQWKEVARENYGSKKAKNWIPENYSPDLEGSSEETLTDELQQQREGLEAILSMQGASEQEIESLEYLAKDFDKLEIKVKEDLENYHKSEKDNIEALEFLNEFPPVQEKKSYQCPNCEEKLELVNKASSIHLKKFSSLDGDNLIYAQEKNKEAQNSYNLAKSKLKNSNSTLNESRRKLEESKLACEKLAEIDKENNGNRSQEIASEIDKCRESLKNAEERLKAFQLKKGADKYYKNILLNEEIENILKPDGLRKKCIEKALTDFNSKIKSVCKSLYKIEVKENLEVYMNNRQFFLLSGSEQFICRTILQIVISEIQESPTIIIDGADIMDSFDREKVISCLSDLNKTSIVSMTILKKEQTPILQKFGIGKTFWIESGTITEMKGE